MVFTDLPCHVQQTISRAVTAQRELQEALERGRRLDSRFRAGGRYEAEEWLAARKWAKPALESLQYLRQLAQDEGIDLQPYFDHAGILEPGPELSQQGREYLADLVA